MTLNYVWIRILSGATVGRAQSVVTICLVGAISATLVD